MPLFSPGFSGRRDSAVGTRLPPGQYFTEDFPVLSAGRTSGALLLAEIETRADYALIGSHGGCTTDVPLEEMLDGAARVGGPGPRIRARRPAVSPR